MKVALELTEQQPKDLNREIEKSNRKYEKRNNGVLIGSIYINVTDKRGYDISLNGAEEIETLKLLMPEGLFK